MRSTSIFLCFFFCVFASFSFRAKAQANVTDSLALVDLYNSTGGPRWYHHDNWLVTPVRYWYGITLQKGRVYNLDLYTNNLTGTIPASIGNLARLNYFRLLDNHLTGTIPASISNLTNLVYLNLSINQLTDTVPASIGNLVKLTDLYLSDNPLTGSIPFSFGNLTRMVTFNLRNCRYSGSIPPSLGNLTKMNNFYLDRNQLTGQVPESLFHLANLITVDIHSNKLTYKDNIDPSSAFVSNASYNVSYNRFTFNGIEYFASKFPHFYSYSPQAQIKVQRNGGVLYLEAGGTVSNNTYYWYRKGTPGYTLITGDSTFLPATTGRYYAKVTNSHATALTLHTDTVQYTTPPAMASAVTLYPNPARGMITVNGLEAQNTNTINISNSYGAVLLRITASNQQRVQCDISKLKPGNYLLSVSNGITIKTLSFIKQ